MIPMLMERNLLNPEEVRRKWRSQKRKRDTVSPGGKVGHLKWAAADRSDFARDRLFRDGPLARADLVDRFGTSGAPATEELSR